MSDCTRPVGEPNQGNPNAAEELLPLIYAELRKVAAIQLARERPGQTLQPTALVHEAWLRLAGSNHQRWGSLRHFSAAAAEAMRRILVDNARRKLAQRHGGRYQRVEMPEIAINTGIEDDQLLALNDALDKFTTLEPQKAELVKLRYFGGMTIEETAEALTISVATAKRYWAYARAWLAAEIANRS